ncbi:MAG: hypothetical protein ACRC1H_11595, partial [Caldilineaceae bacterium]
AAGSTVDPSAINGLLAGGEGGAVVAVDETLRVALAGGVSVVFWAAFVAALLALVATLLAPGGKIAVLAAKRTGAAPQDQAAVDLPILAEV